MARLSRRRLSGAPATGLAVARGMVAVLTGRPADEAARPLLAALSGASEEGRSWDMRAALLWSLLAAEQFSAVEAALVPLREQADRSGSSRGLVAVYSRRRSSNGSSAISPGPTPRRASRFAWPRTETSRAAWPSPPPCSRRSRSPAASSKRPKACSISYRARVCRPASGTALIPAARGRLRLAQGRPREALGEFESCMALWQPQIWGIPIRDAGYLHARAGAAHALLALGEAHRARKLAEAELADTRRFRGRRALGISLRAAGVARGGAKGLAMLEESAAVLGGVSRDARAGRVAGRMGSGAAPRRPTLARRARSCHKVSTGQRAAVRTHSLPAPARSCMSPARGRAATGPSASRR